MSEIPPERARPRRAHFDRRGACESAVRRRQALEQEHRCSTRSTQAGRRRHKIIVPVDKYPGYNFFGAIIGREATRRNVWRKKRMQDRVRGKGAIKDGCGRHDGRPLGPEDEEPCTC